MMSSVITVKDRFPWRKSQIRDAAVFGVLALVGLIGTILGFVVNPDTFPIPVFATVFGVGVLVVLVSVIGNSNAKRNSTMFADLDTDTYKVNAWMHKPTKAIWGDKLNRVRNQGDLTTLQKIGVTKVGKYTVLRFDLADDKHVYLPDRLYAKPETRDFLLKFVESRNGQVPAESKEAMQTFAGVLNAGKEFPKGNTKGASK